MEKQRYVDLHMHTNYSDGIFVEPKHLLVQARLNGLDVIAISDHDHIAAYDEAKNLALDYNLTLLPASEITTDNYHLLAINFDPQSPKIRDFLSHSRQLQEGNVRRKIDYLNERGIPIRFDEVKERFPHSRLGSYNLFMTLFENPKYSQFLKGEEHYFRNFKKLTSGQDKTQDTNVGVSEAIEAVHNAGGLIGFAHPPKDIKRVEELDDLVLQGIDFLEIQPNARGRKYNVIDYDFVGEYANQKGLALSYGSDYHGSTMDRVLLQSGGENKLTPELRGLLNKGYVKID